jgi:glycosyltransferase involved in cell wall biosynthesis
MDRTKIVLTVSIVICTRGRGASILETIESILSSESGFDKLIIIDQNDDSSLQTTLQPFISGGLLEYVKVPPVGAGAARNFGLEKSISEIVVFTDDDCAVSPNWIDAHLAVFDKYAGVVMTYGRVEAAKHDSSLGYIPAYDLNSDRHVRSFKDKSEARGIGANNAVRRKEILAIGGYDPNFGPGSYFGACVDGEMTLRVLARGYEVYECKDSAVTHFGFRDWDAGRKHTYSNWFAIGAACAKPLRLGRWDALPVVAAEGYVHALFPFVKQVLTFQRPLGLARVVGFVKGFVVGWRTPVDPKTHHYRLGGSHEPDITRPNR